MSALRPIPPEEAWRRLVPHLGPSGRSAPVARRDALGRVLAREVRARHPLPAEDVSAMDGYAAGPSAVRTGIPVPVVATVAAGDPPGLELPAGTTARIMTGAPLPRGADRVVPIEQTERVGGNESVAGSGIGNGIRAGSAAAAETEARGGRAEVILRTALAPGANVRRRGEVAQPGDVLLPAGHRLTPASLALLAGLGIARVEATAPRVAVLATGDEVVFADFGLDLDAGDGEAGGAGQDPPPGHVRDTHTDFVLAMGRWLGLDIQPLGIAPDRLEDLEAALERGLAHDVLIVCGGVSAGAFDLVEPALERLGAEVLFDAVAIQPGKPMAAFRHAGGLVFGLPGNPGSAMVCCRLFVEPALRHLQGEPLIEDFWADRALPARLTAPLQGAGDRDRFLPAYTRLRHGLLEATPHLPRGSHDLPAFAAADALLRIRAGSPAREAGEGCEVLPGV